MKPNKKALVMLAGLIAIIAIWYIFQHGGLNRLSKPNEGMSQIKVGGEFTLTNHYGEIVTTNDYLGRYMLIFFGFTYCPDICPTTLTTISLVLDDLGEIADKIVPVFVTVDPERDTSEFLSEYLQHFHPAIQGLTGTDEQIKKIAKAYGIYYAKAKIQSVGELDDYTIDHTALTFLMSPDGSYKAHFGHDVTVEQMAQRLSDIISTNK